MDKKLDKNKEINKKIIWKVVGLLWQYRKRMVVIIAGFAIMTVFSFFYPMIVKNITDKGMVERNLSYISWYSLLLLLFLITEQLISLGQTHLYIGLKNQFQYSLFYNAFTKLLHLKLSYFEDKNSTEIMNRMSTDIQMVSIVADSGVMNLLNYVLRMVSGTVGLFVIEKRLAAVVLIFVPLKYWLVTRMSKKKECFTEEYIEKARAFSSWFSDIMNGIREIKLWNLYRIKQKAFYLKQEDVIQSNKKNTMMDAYNGSTDAMLNGMITCILYFAGGWLVCREGLSIGSIIAFLSYSAYVTGPISAIFNMKYLFAEILPSAKRLFDFLEMEEEISGTSTVESDSFHSLAFEHVSYSYDDKPLLSDVSFQIEKGSKTAIIGKNGSGKSTILKLLLRLLQPASGEILVNGEKMEMCSLDSWRNLFGVVSQDVYLFQETIRNNIDMKEENGQEDVLYACRKSCMDQFVESLPKGLDSLLGQNGVNLSGGERQKIAVARALVKDAPVIVLDEATSNFDVESNQALQEMILEDFKDKTLLMITHDYRQLEKMDRVYQLEDGVLHQVK